MATVGRPPGGEKFGGRQKGVLNKATADVRKMAQTYGPEAVDTLAEIMRDESKPDAARIAAAKELLDRGFGKSPQILDLSSSDGTMTPVSKGMSEFYKSADVPVKPPAS